jgi:tRNA modification GTPase
MYYGYIVDNNGDIIDEVTMVQMPPGKSYTGDSQVEIFCHGGRFVLKRILNEIFQRGARPAEPGEFTRRAFLAGRIDLARAEAVADLVAAKTEYAYQAARNNLMGQLSEHIDKIRDRAIELLAEIEASIDYPEEDIQPAVKEGQLKIITYIIEELKRLVESYQAGKIIREGFKIAIAGRPNAGKSSLFNLLLNQSRAIVAPVPGTTRDYLTEWIDLHGVAVSVTDTAGLRGSAGQVEKAGQIMAEKILENADLVIWIADIARKNWKSLLEKDLPEFNETVNVLTVLNKIDLVTKDKYEKKNLPEKLQNVALLSCKTEEGFDELKKELIQRIESDMPDLTDQLVVTSERHKKKMVDALKSFGRAGKGIKKDISPELIAFELNQAVNEIDEITGKIYNEEVLDRIFSRFCIGK